ncbi:hypothetical protein DTO212C5_434 [Paecilomyces variotii]|nr:hypothetical protein DTO212C5_434 [Paecilomyces variotii]
MLKSFRPPSPVLLDTGDIPLHSIGPLEPIVESTMRRGLSLAMSLIRLDSAKLNDPAHPMAMTPNPPEVDNHWNLIGLQQMPKDFPVVFAHSPSWLGRFHGLSSNLYPRFRGGS